MSTAHCREKSFSPGSALLYELYKNRKIDKIKHIKRKSDITRMQKMEIKWICFCFYNIRVEKTGTKK